MVLPDSAKYILNCLVTVETHLSIRTSSCEPGKNRNRKWFIARKEMQSL